MNETLNQKLLTRTKSALIFGVVVIGLLSFSYWTNLLFLALVTICCYYELQMLKPRRLNQIEFNEIMITVISLLFVVVAIWKAPDDLEMGISYCLLLSIPYAILAIANLYSSLRYFNYVKYLRQHAEIYILYPMIIATLLIQRGENFNYFLLKVILLIWICDSGAYLVGSRIGKNKLFPSVSPNKTMEGSLGAGIFTLLGAFTISTYFDSGNHMYWLLLGLVVWIFGTYGDLVQSKIKRQFGIKDTGNIMPGHGGFLDRFDSFIFVWPFIGLLHLFIQP